MRSMDGGAGEEEELVEDLGGRGLRFYPEIEAR
jgi:hypothetical protein